VIVRKQQAGDYEAIRHIYAAAFAQPEKPESVPLEVGIFETLWAAGDAIPELSFTALKRTGRSGTSRRAGRRSPRAQSLPWDRSVCFRRIKASASGAP
jgi:hypothetical protein